MKICTICNLNKDISEFNKNERRKDNLQNICRLCSNLRSKYYYKNNKGKHKEIVAKRKKKVKKRNSRFYCKFITGEQVCRLW